MFGNGKLGEVNDSDLEWIEQSVANMRSEQHRDELREGTTQMVMAMVASGRVDPTDDAALRAAVAQAAKANLIVRVEVRRLIK